MQNVEDILMRLGEAKYFTLIDLEKGFLQIIMSEIDREKQSFILTKGCIRFMYCHSEFEINPLPYRLSRQELGWELSYYRSKGKVTMSK